MILSQLIKEDRKWRIGNETLYRFEQTHTEKLGSQHLPAILHNIQNGKYENLIPMKSVIYDTSW